MWHFRFLFEHLIPYTPFCMIFTQKLWIKSTNPQWKIKIMYFVGTRFCWERIFHHVQLSKSIVFIYTSIHMAGAIFFLNFWNVKFFPNTTIRWKWFETKVKSKIYKLWPWILNWNSYQKYILAHIFLPHTCIYMQKKYISYQ